MSCPCARCRRGYLQSVPDAEPAVAPNHDEFTHMLAAMMAAQPEPQPAADI